MSRLRRRIALAVAALLVLAAVAHSEPGGCKPDDLKCASGLPAHASDEVNDDDGLQDTFDLDRKRRSSDFRIEVNEGQTTTFYLKTDTPARGRSLGLITSTKGVFVNADTTTVYATEILGSLIDGTYARIQSTSSRVFSALEIQDDEFQPTGVVSSNVVTRIRGETTTIEQTDFVHTFIDGVYAKEILSTTNVFAPLHQTEQIQPSGIVSLLPTVEVEGSKVTTDADGKFVFQKAHLTQIVGERVIASSMSSVLDEDRVTEEEGKKLITSFTEDVSDNNLRARKELDLADNDLGLSPTKPKVAASLPTVRAGESFDDAFASPEKSASSSQTNPDFHAAISSAVVEKGLGDVSSLQHDHNEFSTNDGLVTVRYSGFADFTTSIGNTVVIFSPSSVAVDANPKTSAALTVETTAVPEIDVTEEPEILTTISKDSDDTVDPPAKVIHVEPLIQPGVVVTAVTAEEAAEDQSREGRVMTSEENPFVIVAAAPESDVESVTNPSADSAMADKERPAQVSASHNERGRKIASFSNEQAISSSLEDISSGSLMEAKGTPVTNLVTYTFYTTFFLPEDGTTVTSISSREVVSTEVEIAEDAITATETIEPSSVLEAMGTTEVALAPSVTTIFTTYTYFTTFFDDRTTKMLTREEVVSNVVTLAEQPAATTIEPSISPDEPTIEMSTTQSFNRIFSSITEGLLRTLLTTYTYLTTALVSGTTTVFSSTEVFTKIVTPSVALTDLNEDLLAALKKDDQGEDVISLQDAVEKASRRLETSQWQGHTASAVEESTHLEIQPDAVTAQEPVPVVESSPVVLESGPDKTESLLKTFYTTFTYFTTFFNEGTTDIVSREETITNIVDDATELLEPSSSVPMVYPVTYFTTYTYWTTSYSEDQTFVNSREETVSNVVTPGQAESTEAVEPTVISPIAPTIAPEVLQHATTFYTTYTYLTTTFDGDSTVVASSFETVTNVVNGATSTPVAFTVAATAETSANSARNIGIVNAVEQILELDASQTVEPSEPLATGILSTARSSEINDGTTTLFTTEVIGTFINGHYATILESSSEIIAPTTVNALPESSSTQVTGVISVDIATAYDVGSPTTTIFTSRAIGTLIGNLYAQVIETSSSLKIDSGKTVTEDVDSFKTGLVRSITGSIVKNSQTTVYESRFLGTFVNGLYAQVIESTSSIFTPAVSILSSEVTTVEPTELPPVIVPSTVIESSIQSTAEGGTTEELDEEELGKAGKGRVKTRLSLAARPRTFTPSIRPFTQRTRPAFALKKKRPPFTGSNGADDNANSILPSSVLEVEPTETSSSRSAFNRFRQTSVASVSSSPKLIESTEAASKSRFFKTRPTSSASSTSQASVSRISSSSVAGRRLTSSVSPTPVVARSSSSGVAFGRSSSLVSSSRIRGSSALPGLRSSVVSSGFASSLRSSILPTSTSSRVEAVETSVPESAFVTDQDIQDESPTTSPTRAATRRPLFRPVSAEANTDASAAPVTTRRKFPLSRASSLGSAGQKPAEEPKVAEASVTTSKPRFVRPPKLTFTEKSRNTSPARRLFKRPNSEDDTEALEETVIDEVVIAAGENAGRSKRDVYDFDYEFYDPVHYRRPSRNSAKRTRARPVQEPDYFDYEASEDEVVTSTRGRTSFRDRGTSSRQTTSTSSRAISRPRPSTPSRGSEFTLTNRQTSSGSRFRKPQPDGLSSTRSSFRRPESTTSSRAKTSSRVAPATEKPSTARRFSPSSRRGSGRPKPAVENDVREKVEPVPAVPREPVPALAPTLTVTHYVPAETTIPVINGGVTEFKTIVTAKPSTEILFQYSSTKIQGSWRFIASEVSSTPQIGVTEVTQFVIKPTETTTVEFTPTVIRGRQTSFSHIIPSTIYDIEPVVSTITDPVASTNSLLQQLLLGGLGGLQQNPLLGNLGAAATPVTSYSTFTTTYVTTLTDLKSTVLPITLRGKEFFTTIVASSTSVITATEFSTQTIVSSPSPLLQAPAFQPNPLASLLPALLGNPLLQAQLLNQGSVPSIVQTQAPAEFKTEVPTLQSKREERIQEEEELEDLMEQITPDRPIPVTSVVTLFISGRRPGEFSSILSTVTLDGPDASVVKRQTEPSQIAEILEQSALPVLVGTDKGVYALPEKYEAADLDYYVMSAINDIGSEVGFDAVETEKLDSYVEILKGGEPVVVRKVRQAEDEELGQDIDPTTPKSVRRKTVIVTRKKAISPSAVDVVQSESTAVPNRKRKVVVVTRKKSLGKSIDDSEPVINAELENKEEVKAEPVPGPKRRVVVITKKKAVTESPPPNNVPVIESSKDESNLGGSFGDIYAPRTYYTVYSYLYTILNGGKSGSVSSREVTISELVRGKDSRIPVTFARTESAVGLYTLTAGGSIADLGTRVSNGVTTQVNLASLTLVKYGRGPIKTKTIDEVKIVESETKKPVRGTARIAPTARIEPSFEPHFEDEETTTVPTQRLPSRTRGRTTKTTKPSVAADTVTESVTTSSRRSRGRGTVRFAAGTSPSVDGDRVAPSTVKTSRRPTKTVAKPKPVRDELLQDDIHDYNYDYRDDRNDLALDYENNHHEEEPLRGDEHHEDYVDEPVHDDEPLYDDEPLEDDYFNEERHGDEEYHDQEFTEEEAPLEEAVTEAKPEVSSTTTTTTQSQVVKPTRFTISRKLVNPLESHLSSIRAQSRLLASSRESIVTSTTTSPVPFRARLASRLSSTNSLVHRNSTIVYKTFSTTSTLPVDGRRSAIQLTLVTSTLTTLFDDEIRLVTESPEIFKPVVAPSALPSRLSAFKFNPSTRVNLPFLSSLRGSSSSFLPSPEAIEGTIEDSTITESSPTEFAADTTESGLMLDAEIPTSTDIASSIDDETTSSSSLPFSLPTPQLTVTKVETELRTFTAIVTRKNGDQEEVTTRTEIVPELVTKTVVLTDPTQVLTSSLDDNFLPTARAVPSGDVVIQDVAGAREPRLNVVNNRQNLATKVMSNGVEVIVAGDRKPSLLAHEVIRGTETISPSAPVTLAPSAIQNQVAVATDIENVHLLSSIQSDPAQFSAHTHLTTLTYLTTLLDGNSTVVSKRQEVITNVVTRETGSDVKPTIAPDVTLTAGFLNPNYQTLKLFTTYTYSNTFTDGSRPVTLTSRETISNMFTVPDSGSIAAVTEILLDTNTYFRTYTFSKTLNDQVVTTQEVVTQVVVTEAPKIVIEPTPIAEGTAAIEPTPLIEGSKTEILEDEDIPLVATKTFFTTSTLFTTLLEGTNTVVVSRTQVVSSVATTTITGGLDLFTKSLLAAKPDQITPSISEIEAAAEETPVVKASIVTSTTVIPGIDGTSSTVVPGATVIMVTNTAGEVIVLPTEVLTVEPSESSTTQSSGDSPAEKGGIAALLSSLGLSALRQGLASNNKNGINLETVIDAMSGIISNSLANRRNDSSPARITAPEQPVPLREPQFIPISGPEPFIPAQNPQGRTPIQTNVVPTAQRLPGQVPVRRPEPGIPLVPAAPGSPLLRPGATFVDEQRPPQPTNQFGVIQVIPGRPLTQLPGQPVPIQINVNPPVQTGFTGIPNIPIPVPTRAQPAPVNRPPPPPAPAVIPPFVPGKNNIDRIEIQPTVPLNKPPASAQFFAANGQPIIAPPLPPGPGPQRAVESLPQGSIVPGPDGVPVRIIAVPEGQRPPPGAEGHVFIRPAVSPPLPVPRPQLEPPRAERPQVQPKPVPQPIAEILPSRREDSLLLSTERQVLPSFQLPAVQTIASIEGDNKIVRTRIVSNGQNIDIEPTETVATVVEQPSAIPIEIESTSVVVEIEPTTAAIEIQPTAVSVEVEPTVAAETTAAVPTTVSTTSAAVTTPETIENGEAVEVVGNVLQPTVSQPPQIEGTLIVMEENSPEATPEVIQTTPRIETSSVEPLNPPMSETHTTIVSESSTVVEKATTIFGGLPASVLPEILEKSTETFGITSVIMGPEEVFTTFVTRAEEPSQTVVSTIVGQVTEVNNVTPTATIEVTSEEAAVVEEEETSQMNKFTQEPERPAAPTFPPESPFNPPTQAPATFKSTTTSTTTSTTPMPVSETVQEETGDNRFIVAGIGGSFGVNQPATTAGCNCGAFEICQEQKQGSTCVCRPGYSRLESGQPCRKSYAYQLSLVLERVNDTMLHYDENLSNSVSPQYLSLASAAKDGLHQALMKSEISDKVFTSEVMAIHPVTKMNPVMDGVLVDFFVQLAEQHDEEVLTNQLMKSLEATNYSLGDSQIYAARFTDSLQAQDFDECSHEGYNDCSEFATCVNEKGSYKCQCNPGFVDSSDDTGRICLAELKDCEKCNRNGRCVFDPESNQMGCVCNYWFAGKECQFNLKVLMIVILAVGSFVILFVLALIVLCCLRSRRAKGAISAGPSFLRYKGPSGPTSGTLDRTAMIRGDTSSESSGGAGADNLGATGTLENGAKAVGPALQSYRPYGEGLMIPRVKTHQNPANKASAAERGEAAKREQQLIDYLESKRRSSEGAKERSSSVDNLSKSRSSEALAAAGRSSVSSLSQFRSSLADAEAGHHDTDKILDQVPDEMTVSEVRSYDETTIRPAVRRPSKYYQSDDSDNNSNFDSF